MESSEFIGKLEEFGPKAWVEALRSPKYKHMKGALGDIPEDADAPIPACCLGVLVHAAGVSSTYKYVDEDEDRRHLSLAAINHEGHTGTLVAALLPSWMTSLMRDDLVAMNDADPTTDYTRQIAYIEEVVIGVPRTTQAGAA